jgi:hypothetical protein
MEESPCIDSGSSAGVPDTDVENALRPQGNGYDIGAYECKRPKNPIFSSESIHVIKVA